MTSSDNPAILQVIPALDAGGAERTTIDIARALVRDGLRALVATAGGRMEPLLAGVGAEIAHLPLATKAPHVMLRNAARLSKLMHGENIKLVHARSRAPAWSTLLAARRHRIPFVTTYHGIYNASNPLKRLYNSVMAKSDAVIANSQWTADHIVREHHIPREQITVIYRGIDLEAFDTASVSPQRIQELRAQWGASDDQKIILLPGRLTRWKGQLVLIEALAKLAGDGLLGNVKAVLLGDAQGRTGYVTELRDAIAGTGLHDAVRIAPHVIDMPVTYLASDIVVSASTDPEAFGRVAAEASAMARPVVATDHGGARETVLGGRSGLLVLPGNASALAGALRTLLAMPADQRSQMGREGRAHVRSHFSLEHMCTKTLTLYRRMLARGSRL